jgi:hypothetical protein
VSQDEPKISVEMLDRVKDSQSGFWAIGWHIKNLTGQPMKFFATRLPHGQFKGQEQEFKPLLEVAPKSDARIETSVQCDGEPETLIENAFLILLCEWQGERWRIFARLRVTINQQGEPAPITELITTQKVGFSGLS